MGREHTFDDHSESSDLDPFGLGDVLDAAARSCAVDPDAHSDEVLMSTALAVEAARNTLEVLEARILDRLETTGAVDTALGMRTGSWLAWETDTNPAKCRAKVTTARRIGWFGEFGRALTDNRVGFAHAEVLASVANPRNRDGLRDLQDVLIELAGSYRLREWSALVRALADDLDQDGSFDPADDPYRNRLTLRDNHDGTIGIKGHLNSTSAVTVTQGLEALADELFRRYSNDREVDPDLEIPSRSRLLAEALTEAVRRAAAVDLGSTTQPRIEATIVIEDTPHSNLGADDTIAGDTRDIGCRDLDGRVIPTITAELLFTDPTIRALVLDGDGVPLRLGRKVRFATPDQRTALAIRDGGCIFPGCDMPPSWCDAHHQPGWTNGGTTDIDTMFLTCRHHHTVTHRNNWRCEPDANHPQRWTWTTPSGLRLHSQRRRGHPE